MGFKQQEETDIPVNLTIGRHRSWGGEVRYTKQGRQGGKSQGSQESREGMTMA